MSVAPLMEIQVSLHNKLQVNELSLSLDDVIRHGCDQMSDLDHCRRTIRPPVSHACISGQSYYSMEQQRLGDQISRSSHFATFVHRRKRCMRPLENGVSIKGRYVYLASLTKLDQQTNDHANEDCPLSGIDVVVAYVLDVLVRRAVDAALD